MQSGIGDPIKIAHVLARRRAEPIEAEVRVARLERIEGPVHPLDAEWEKELTLETLERLAESAVAIARVHAEGVGPVTEPAVADPAHPEDEAGQLAVVSERAGGDAAHVADDTQQRGGDEVVEVVAPHFALQAH